MNQVEKISLLDKRFTYSDIGVPQVSVAKTDVLAFRFSVGQTEFFNAGQQGLKPTGVFAVRSTEYEGQEELEFNGEVFSIYRSYNRTDGRTELYTSKRKGANDISAT